MTTDATRNLSLVPGRPWLIGVIAFIVFGVVGAGVTYYGIRIPTDAVPGPSKLDESRASSVTRIILPADDTPIPAGPHREDFRAACTVCHSPRLVFTQPLLTEKQWTAVVHKMTAKYGAPLSADDEKRMVQYLHVVHGK